MREPSSVDPSPLALIMAPVKRSRRIALQKLKRQPVCVAQGTPGGQQQYGVVDFIEHLREHAAHRLRGSMGHGVIGAAGEPAPFGCLGT